jgi:hypothetical protein
MITLTESARRLVDIYRRHQPHFDWCLRIHWQPGTADNFRAPDGRPEWIRTIPDGWVVTVEPYHHVLHGSLKRFEASGLKVFVDPAAPARDPFTGGVVDAAGIDLCLNAAPPAKDGRDPRATAA